MNNKKNGEMMFIYFHLLYCEYPERESATATAFSFLPTYIVERNKVKQRGRKKFVFFGSKPFL